MTWWCVQVEAIINNIMAKELLGPSVGSKEEQLQRKQQILEELQKVNKHQYVSQDPKTACSLPILLKQPKQELCTRQADEGVVSVCVGV